MRQRTYIAETSAALVLFFSIIAASPLCSAAEPVRQPVPDVAAVSKSRQLIRSAYEAEYQAAMRSKDPSSLMFELDGSIETTKDPVRQYALLSETESLARQYNDLTKALAIINKRARLFEEDGLKLQAEMLQGLAGPKVSGDAVLLDRLMHTANQAAVAERFEIATDLAKSALSIAKAIDRSQRVARQAPEDTSGPQLIKAAQELQSRINDRKKAFATYREAEAILKNQPDDPQANAVVGTYLCLIANWWSKGLPHLVKSQDSWIGTLAKEEVALRKATPPDPAKIFLLAEKWWDAAGAKESVPGGKDAIRLHAALLYSEVLPHLKDPLEKRVAETRGKPFEGRVVGRRPQANEVQAAAQVFLSDLQEQNLTPPEGFFGKQGRWHNGDPLRLDGKECPKGILLHPDSNSRRTVTYTVPTGFARFRSRYGIHDGSTSGSPLTFKVLDDNGKELAASEALSSGCPQVAFDVGVEHTKTVTLVVECPGSCGSAHAVWLDPRFLGQRPQANELQAAGEVFLSDLPEQNPVVGHGVFGKNGDMGFEDRKIIVGGKASPKGLSMHPPSDGTARVTYGVPDGCTHLRGRVAIGDGTETQSIAVTFRVMNERGELLWESKPIDATGAGEECNIPLRGAKAVTLVVVCPGSFVKAWAVWVDPRFMSASGKPASTPGAPEVFLSDLPEHNVKVHRNMFGKHGRWHDGVAIKVRSQVWPKALFLHPDSNDRSEVTYEVPEGMRRFEAQCGINDGCDAGTPLTFKVLDDAGAVMWKSEPLQKNGSSRPCEVQIGTTRKLTLVVECPGGCGCAHAVWLDPRFIR